MDRYPVIAFSEITSIILRLSSEVNAARHRPENTVVERLDSLLQIGQPSFLLSFVILEDIEAAYAFPRLVFQLFEA